MLAAPNTHFVMLAQSILFRGAGLDVVWPQLLALIVIGSVLFFPVVEALQTVSEIELERGLRL